MSTHDKRPVAVAPPEQASQRGSATLELVLATPLLVLLLLLVVEVGRLATARADVDDAARAAARAASVQRDPRSATVAARRMVVATLAERGVTCRRLDSAVDARAFHPGGWVAVDLTCTVSLSDLTLLRLPASRAIHSRFVESVDTFRGPAT